MTREYEIDKTNGLLDKVMPNFNFNEPPINPIDLADIMAECLKKYNGIGLAANQIGLPYRCFILRTEPMIIMFNPKIVDISEKTSLMEEGCLSFPNINIRVKRHDGIRVRYTAPSGNTTTENFKGMTARIIQHEIDHLDGITFLDRASVVQRNKALNMMKKQRRIEKQKTKV